MKITFNIHYYTKWGQQVAVIGNHPDLGNNSLDKALLLSYQKDGFWDGSIHVDADTTQLEYKYLIIDSTQGSIISEWGDNRTIDLPDSSQQPHLWLRDSWRAAREDQNVFHTSAFINAIFKPAKFRRKATLPLGKNEVVLRFKMIAPTVPSGLQVGIIGDIEELGNWNQNKILLLDNKDHPQWRGEIKFPKYRVGNISYKYCLYDPQKKKVVQIEGGSNRQLKIDTLFDKDYIVISNQIFMHPEGSWKGGGMAIPVFSIRTKNGLGVGEFKDIQLMVDWAKECGMRMVQILPVNDTTATYTWVDSYPYSAISVFALHPILLNLDELFDTPIKELQDLKEELNALDTVDYDRVIKAKMEWARKAYQAHKESFFKDKDFKKFFKENKFWLESYAAFCYLRDKNGTADFNQWGEDSTFSTSLLKKMCATKSAIYEEVAFYYFLQYHLDRQLREAADYARSKGVVLKGDLPIGIYRYSVDAWVAPELYHMDGQSGAPPDPFSDDGQNWGFPTYNWEKMAEDGYEWWKNRMRQLARYFDAYRIDHILGFFRIWEIPIDQVDGLLGTFNPAIPIDIQEFAARGINFDPKRFCEPFINESILVKLFPEMTDFVKIHFLDDQEDGTYQLKTELNTQRKILAFFSNGVWEEKKEQLLKPLYQLVGNVLFIRDKANPATNFHPRIEIEKTSTFQALDKATQDKVRELYYDYFYNRQEDFWKEQAMKKLPALRAATDMLICGEDLGMVPQSVPGVMQDLNILTLEIQRMSKNPATEFLSESDIPYLSVASPSTHDMAPVRAWWEESKWEQVQRFYEQELKMIGDHPFYCEPYIAQAIINQHLAWPSMWTIFPVQDLLAMDGRLRRKDPFTERINVPANPKHYWRYRMHLNVEQLIEENAFNKMLYAMLSSAKRI